MSFLSTLPAQYQGLVTKRRQAQFEAISIEQKLDDSSLASEHGGCDCEYCPYKDMVTLNLHEGADLEDRQCELEDLIAAYDKTLAAIERYAKSMGVNLK